MSTVNITFSGNTYSEQSISEMRGGDIVALHNAVAEVRETAPVKRFSDKRTAIKRTWKALNDWVDEEQGYEGELPADDGTDEVGEETESTEPKQQRKARGMRFQFEPLDVIKGHRPNTNRAALIALLSEGATFEQCLDATWRGKPGMSEDTQRKTCYEAIRLLHYYVGYGMDHDLETGVIRLRTYSRCGR